MSDVSADGSGARSSRSSAGALTPSASTPPAECSPRAPEPSTSPLTLAFRKGRPALVAYVMGGYPDRAGSLEALRTLAAAGADVIELGVPYGDALADGPTIVRAANEAMRANAGGFGLAEAIDLAAEFLADPGVDGAPPLALMTYYNPMLRLGLARIAEDARAAGVAGFIVPDMPPDVAGPWLDVAADLDTVFLAAPTSTAERLAVVGERSGGFVYCVSTTGVTGARAELSRGLETLVLRIRAFTSLPVAVGFGISTPKQAAAVADIADGVVVGSAIVSKQHDIDALRAFACTLAAAVHGA